MHGNVKDISGLVFGKLTVIKMSDKRDKGAILWECTCKCGTTVLKKSTNLQSGDTTSCGCGRKTHNMSNTKEYSVWEGMKQRCFNPKNFAYKYYGGRGIKVCEEWLLFENFIADIISIPEGLSLDRIDNDGDYCKDNCRLVDQGVQVFSRGTTRTNTSGKTGVRFLTKKGKWEARIGYKGKTYTKSNFSCYEDAVTYRLELELKYYGEYQQ